VKIKLNALKEAVNGKRVVMIDDSIVRVLPARDLFKFKGCRCEGSSYENQLSALYVSMFLWS